MGKSLEMCLATALSGLPVEASVLRICTCSRDVPGNSDQENYYQPATCQRRRGPPRISSEDTGGKSQESISHLKQNEVLGKLLLEELSVSGRQRAHVHLLSTGLAGWLYPVSRLTDTASFWLVDNDRTVDKYLEHPYWMGEVQKEGRASGRPSEPWGHSFRRQWDSWRTPTRVLGQP